MSIAFLICRRYCSLSSSLCESTRIVTLFNNPSSENMYLMRLAETRFPMRSTGGQPMRGFRGVQFREPKLDFFSVPFLRDLGNQEDRLLRR